MPRGDKSAYTEKQKRQAQHIEDSYEARGASEKEAASRAWATVNQQDHGGKKSGSGNHTAAYASQGGGTGRNGFSSEKRTEIALKGWATRRRHAT